MSRKKQVFDVLSFRPGRYWLCDHRFNFNDHHSNYYKLQNVSKFTLFHYLDPSVSCVQLLIPFV